MVSVAKHLIVHVKSMPVILSEAKNLNKQKCAMTPVCVT